MDKKAETKIIKEINNILNLFGDKYIIQDVVNKAKVIQDLDDYNQELIGALLNNETLNNQFVIKINGATIFKVNQLIEVFQLSDYWMDSYTKYTKKIGLTTNKRFIDEFTDIVLDFPYKDTILKATMSKEEKEHEDLLPNEPFLNEVVAKEEIDVLLDKKILVNAKKYTVNGEHEIKEFSDEDNLVIKGNNLLTLHTIKEKYAGKVKMIYIDPPYYFKDNKEKDAFTYNSNFHNSTWLIFMKNRLEIAKELLQEGGTIWISISEDGMHYLKLLCDSIFGAAHFLGTTPRRTRDGKSDVPFNYSQDFDWLLAYTNVSDEVDVIGRKVERKYYTSPDFPNDPWRLADLTTQKNAIQRPNSYFTMIDPKTGKEYPASKKRTWAVTKETFNKYYDIGYVVFPDDYDFLNISKPYARKFKSEDEKSGKLSSIISDFSMKPFLEDVLGKSKNKQGTAELEAFEFEEGFSYPKPENLLKSIIEVSTNENDLVLDFFMGSATTQAVAMKMKRRFIGIEQMNYINTVSVPRLQKVIEGEQGGVSKEFNWLGGSSFVYAELMEKNQGFLKTILNAKEITTLKDTFNLMLDTGDFDFQVDLKKVYQSLWNLPFEEQKKILVKIIDKNQLYFNSSEMDDENVRKFISENDYIFNKSFYEK